MATNLQATLACAAAGSDEPNKHTTSPIVTGTSVLAIKYKDGVVVAADTLGSYGSLARFTEVDRICKAGEETLVACDGDISDWQFVQKILKELEMEDYCFADSISYTPHQYWSGLTRILYNRRSKFNPLWNNLVIAGFSDKKPFLGTTDKIGTSYEADFVATGMGLHMALPVMRREWKPDMSEAEARKLIEDCLRVLFYRDCRTINRISFAIVNSHGTKIEEPRAIQTEWNFSAFINPSGPAA